ncbi:predicted protein [Nematostella vectensis]|uniref:Uncharacterized protein n=1 Tax=Nematostella vectensis TaxID=45351 RepID=A7SD30_NEMVE|nr:predicted protein [Nematostella vectensis]|eukprot:XP_001630416.1 predicted protein [Nematostella vectensis]
MDGSDDKGKINEGRVKTFAPPEIIAAILDPEDALETVRNTGENGVESQANDQRTTLTAQILSMEDGEPFGNDNISREDELLRDSLNDSLEFEVKDSFQDEEEANRNSTAKDKRSTINSVNSKHESIKSRQSVKSVQSTSNEVPNAKNKSANPQKLGTKTKTEPSPPKVNFIDKNKEVGKRTKGGSYAAKFQQKVKLKYDKDFKGHSTTTNNLLEETSEQYDYFESSFNSRTGNALSNTSGTHLNANMYGGYASNMSTYYNPENTYGLNNNPYSMPQEYAYWGSVVDAQYQYLNQPYQTPCSDFGLRYSNHGQQSYQPLAGAATYPYNGYHRAYPVMTQGYTSYSSQSAPPGGPNYARQPLIERVEFFAEHDDLALSLPNSRFVNNSQRFQEGSLMQRRFVSEPQLSTSPMIKDSKGPESGNNGGDSLTSPRQPVDYKPYTLKEYRQIRNETPSQMGSLGPDTDSEEYKQKLYKLNKQKEYAEMLRSQHAALKPHWEKKAPPLNPTPARLKQAEAKRKAAMNYAKTVPKPKTMTPRQPYIRTEQPQSLAETGDLTLVEILRLRHEKEKHEVDVIRKDIAAKIRH